MEREIVRKTEQYKGVTFTNFPWYKNPETGELNSPLLDGLLCEDIAEQIPFKLRQSVVIDFTALDYENLLEETKSKHGIHQELSNEEIQVLQNQLVEAIFGNN